MSTAVFKTVLARHDLEELVRPECHDKLVVQVDSYFNEEKRANILRISVTEEVVVAAHPGMSLPQYLDAEVEAVRKVIWGPRV